MNGFTNPGDVSEDRLGLLVKPSKCPAGIPFDGLAGEIFIYDTDASSLLHKSNLILKKGRLNSLKIN
jgi:hypothetical protein